MDGPVSSLGSNRKQARTSMSNVSLESNPVPRPTALGALARDLLKTVGQSLESLHPEVLLRDFDWSARGITHPYVIFMTGRCGSTWLTSLLKGTGLVGNPDEFLNAHVAGHNPKSPRNGLEGYFEYLSANESSNGRFGLEVDSTRLKETEPLIEWNTVFSTQVTTTFFLYRRDLLSQAWSWVSAKKSGIWHIRTGSEKSERKTETIPTHAELRKEMVRIRTGEEFLEGFFLRHGYRPFRIAYESLVAEQTVTTTTILRMLGISEMHVEAVAQAGGGSLTKLGYSDKQRILAEFNCRHRNAMDAIDRDRFGIGSADLAKLLDDC